MIVFDGRHEPIRQGSGGALAGRWVEARSAEEAPRSGPRRAPGTLERSVKVYGATLPVLESAAEAPVMGAGSPARRSSGLQNRKPRGSAAGGTTGASRRWSR